MACLPRTPDAPGILMTTGISPMLGRNSRLVALAAASLETRASPTWRLISCCCSPTERGARWVRRHGRIHGQSARSLFQESVLRRGSATPCRLQGRRRHVDRRARRAPGARSCKNCSSPRRARPPLPRARSISSRRPISNVFLSAGAIAASSTSADLWPAEIHVQRVRVMIVLCAASRRS